MKQTKCQGAVKGQEHHNYEKESAQSEGCSCRSLLSGIAEGDTITVYTNNPTPITGVLENIVDRKVLQLRSAGTLVNICCSKVNYIVRG